MKHLRYDQPVSGDALLLGARLPRREEVPTPPPAPVETSPGVFLAHDGKFFTSLETPKGVSPEGRWQIVFMDDLEVGQSVAQYRLQRLLEEYKNFDPLAFFQQNFTTTNDGEDKLVSADFAKLEERIAAVAAGVELKHQGAVTGSLCGSASHLQELPKRAFGDVAVAVEGQPFDRYSDDKTLQRRTVAPYAYCSETEFDEGLAVPPRGYRFICSAPNLLQCVPKEL